MKIGIVYIGRSWKGDLAEVMTEKDWDETDPQDFRPNTNWVSMSIEEALNDEEIRHHVLDLRVRNIVIQ